MKGQRKTERARLDFYTVHGRYKFPWLTDTMDTTNCKQNRKQGGNTA